MITLGIIGIVAAMTLPTLIQNHQKQTYVTGLKKAYSVIQNAFAQMAADEDVTEWRQTACYNVGLLDCGAVIWGDDGPIIPLTDTSANCLNSLQKSFKVIDITNDLSSTWGNLLLTTSDGIRYSFTKASVDYDGNNYINTQGIGLIDVDINGDKGPNKWGRDRFEFYVNYDKNKIEPEGASNYQTNCTPEKLKEYEARGKYCTAKVLIEGKMDY